jgi:very-short-patch-repair endonuclease
MLEGLGLRVVRVTSEQVERDMAAVLSKIRHELRMRQPGSD